MNDRRILILAKLSDSKSQFLEVWPQRDPKLSMEGIGY